MGEELNEEVPESEVTDDVEYCDEVALFDELAQAQYLLHLRRGMPVRMAAREAGFTPRVVREARRRSSIFDEACEESIAEADEQVEWEARQAMKFHEPWAVKLLAERLGWKREQQKSEGGNSTLPNITGNPFERILKIQDQVMNRGTPATAKEVSEVVVETAKANRVHKKKIIDVSVANEDE